MTDVINMSERGQGKRRSAPGQRINGVDHASDIDVGQPFQPLGHDKGRFFVFAIGAGQVRDYNSRDLHNLATLCELAPIPYWEEAWPSKREPNINVRGAADCIMQTCYRLGVFNPLRLRGRGCWLDDGRVVLHMGDHLVVDGQATSLTIPDSRFIYEQGQRLEVDLSGQSLTVAEASRFLDLCRAVPFETPGQGHLLAGWSVTAPICGALPWRSHLWLTSEAGGGKSWLFTHVLRPVAGPLALLVQSKSTEAGIRQTLGFDARPVLFDEAETQNDADRARVQLILDLARQSSSEEGAEIVKGTRSGRAVNYRIASSFAFSSVNLGLSQAADESRTVVLTLSPSTDPAERVAAFARLQRLQAEVMVHGFASRLLARTLKLLPIIRQNAVTFAEAIARSGRSRRSGDTLGTLLAGAWSLRSDDAITPEHADRIIADTLWLKTTIDRSQPDPDWQTALQALLQHRTRFTNANGRTEDVPIGELIQAAVSYGDNSITQSDAVLTLSRLSIRVVTYEQPHHVQIANNNSLCREVFKHTPWAASWRATLLRAPGSTDNSNRPVRFCQRCR
jgi:putative DNA primase/helicase